MSPKYAKKTSGRYKLVFVDKNAKKKINISCDYMTGELLQNSNSSKNGLDLPILDAYIIKKFRNEGELRKKLEILGYQIPMHYVPKIVYKTNGKEKFLELIYQNQMLYQLAILCNESKIKYINCADSLNILPRDFRKMVSKEIIKEKIWKEFYQELLEKIHNSDFYKFLQDEKVLGDRAFGYIKDYIDNEGQKNHEQIIAFDSARFYLEDTFTAYKPIRGMIVGMLQYQSRFSSKIEQNKISNVCDLKQREGKRSVGATTKIEPLELLTDAQREYLESHEYYEQMSLSEKKDFVGTILGFITVPWYQNVNVSLSPSEIAYLEKHDTFNQLSYFEKIEFVNQYTKGSDMLQEKTLQKRK